MDVKMIQQRVLEKWDIRISPVMGEYVLAQMGKSDLETSASVAIFGGKARTGEPVRQHIDLGKLMEREPA